MFEFLNLFKPKIVYKENRISKDFDFEEVPDLVIPDNSKKNLLIMDDVSDVINVTIKELEFLDRCSEKINESGLENLGSFKPFVEELTNTELMKLTKISLDDFNIIRAEGKMAAFQAMRADSIDYCILDIIIGGHNIFNHEIKILDGIDVAYEMVKKGVPIECILFFSGCSLGETSAEFKKAKDLLGIDITDRVIYKDNNINQKLKMLISLLTEERLCLIN